MRLLTRPDAVVRRPSVRLGLALAAILLACTSQRAAADLPESLGPAHAFGELTFNVPPKREGGLGETVLDAPNGSRLRLASAILPSPSLMAAVVVIGDPYNGRVVGTIDYEVMIVGPETGNLVEVLFSVYGEVQGNSYPQGSFLLKSTWKLESSSGVVISGGIETPTFSDHFYDTYREKHDLFLLPNRRFKVSMFADIFLAPGGPGGSGYAFVDPLFTFGPGVGPEYSFAFSPGVGNTAPVPEPHSFVLMAAGLLALGWRRRLSPFAPRRSA